MIDILRGFEMVLLPQTLSMYQIFWMELIKPFFNHFAKIWAFEIPQNYSVHWDKEQQSKAQNSDSKYRQMALISFDT